MDFEKLLDESVSLKNTVTVVIKTNGHKKAELNRYITDLIVYTQIELAKLVELEAEERAALNVFKLEKSELDSEIKHYGYINEKLGELVSTAQQTSNEKNELDDRNNDDYHVFISTIQEYEQLKLDHSKAQEELINLNEEFEKDAQDVKSLISECKDLVVNLHTNDRLIRVLDQQGKHAEQQFDLILSQLPWEPLAESYIKELSNSSEDTIRDLADNLQVQTNEVNQLNETIKNKEQRKLEILQKLAIELENFASAREQAVLMDFRAHEEALSEL